MQILSSFKHISIALLLATLTTTMSPIVSALTLPQNEKVEATTPTNTNLKSPQEISPGQASSTYQDPTGRSIYNETVVDSTTQTFSWSPVVGASKYALYVRNLDTNVLEVIEENLTSTSYATSSLHAGYHYKWNVRAKDSSNRGGWLSDGYWFRVKDGVAEAPRVGDDRYIDLYVLDENDDPIIDTQLLAVADISCTVINMCIVAGPADMKTDINGKIRFYYDKFKVKGIYVDINNPNASSSNLLFGTSTNNVYVMSMDNNNTTALYQKYNVQGESEFIDGAEDELGLTIGGVVLAKTLISAGKLSASGLTKLAGTTLGTFIVERGGKLAVVKAAAKFIPGVGLFILVGVGAYAVSQTVEMMSNCFTTDQYTKLEDPDFHTMHTSSYFCGRMAVRLTFITLLTNPYVKPGVRTIEEIANKANNTKIYEAAKSTIISPTLNYAEQKGLSLIELQLIVDETLGVEDMAAPEARTLIEKAFALCTASLTNKSIQLSDYQISSNFQLSGCNLATIYNAIDEVAGSFLANTEFKIFTSQNLGKAGEVVAGAVEKFPYTIPGGKNRIADHIEKILLQLWEVKNVNYQANTLQIKDALAQADFMKYKLLLYVRETTKLSGPLKKLVDDGRIILVKMGNNKLLAKAVELSK